MYLCTRISEMHRKFGVWCNGNTADSGPAFPGSSPGTPTKKSRSNNERLFFFNYPDVHNDSQATRQKALRMGSNIVRYVFMN